MKIIFDYHIHPDIEELFSRLRVAWQANTSNAPDKWSPSNPAFGQCAVTALVVQDLVGGELVRGSFADGTHYWNRLPDGREVDLTAGQFNVRPKMSKVELRDREYLLSNPSTCRRYRQLLENLALT